MRACMRAGWCLVTSTQPWVWKLGDLNKLLVWSGSPASGGGMGWVPTVETKGSRDLGFSSRAQPPAGQLLWSSPARPRDCRGEGSRQAPREPQCGLCRRGDEGPAGAGT